MPEQRRLERVLDPTYVADLADLDVEALHAKKVESVELETEFSFVRRLAQGRIDIIEAEQRRRTDGGSMDDFIANLANVLADDGPRPEASHGRLAQQLTPSPDIQWTRGLEHLVGDATLARLPDLSDEELADALRQLKELESDVSGTRHKLHDVLRVLELELAGRIQAAQA